MLANVRMYPGTGVRSRPARARGGLTGLRQPLSVWLCACSECVVLGHRAKKTERVGLPHKPDTESANGGKLQFVRRLIGVEKSPICIAAI